jgi:hypothetical protein
MRRLGLLLILLYSFLFFNSSFSFGQSFLFGQPELYRCRYLEPEEHRETAYVDYLAATVRINNPGLGSGSGTIVYYDRRTRIAYVATCGHLFGADDKQNPGCEITVWYHNRVKLQTPEKYQARVLFWDEQLNGLDSALVIFKPNWEPKYFPIAPMNYQIKEGRTLISTGCDYAKEVAVYVVEFVRNAGEIMTRRNSPRMGRSGGGLIDGRYYVGTCSKSSDRVAGNGVGIFTNLKGIHQVFEKNGYGWLLKIPLTYPAQQIPIVDHSLPNSRYTEEYIIVP